MATREPGGTDIPALAQALRRLGGPASEAAVHFERTAIRLLVPIALAGSAAIAALIAMHVDTAPGVALNSRLVLWLEVYLAFFYGALLTILPLVRALTRGELPTELSARGARYATSNAEATVKKAQGRVDEHDRLLLLHGEVAKVQDAKLGQLAEDVTRLKRRIEEPRGNG